MNKRSLGTLLCLCCSTAFPQGGWTKITDPNNPIVTLNSGTTYKGAAWVDHDNDGDLDLFAAPKYLFRNDGGGTFVEVATTIGAVLLQNPSGCSWADLDNDGDIDCIQAQWPATVYLNNGDATYTDQSSAIDSLANYRAWGCAIGDLDGDPFLDLTYAHAWSLMPSRLFRRSSAAVTGEYLSGYAFTDSLRPFTVPYWSDHDLDGDMDLFIATGPAGTPALDYCYRNMRVETGMDTLYRMTTELFASDPQDGQCYNFVDIDNDLDLDLCLSNYNGAPSRMYLNTSGTYAPIPTPFTVTGGFLGNNWGDFDNDGDLDVITTADGVGARYYTNQGSGSFVLASPGLSTASGACGVTNGDYDNDGDLDVFVHGSNAARSLFRNDTLAAGRHWVNVQLTGVQSNRSAIGAIVRINAIINGNSVWQIREVNAQNAFQSQNDLRVHFGTGDAAQILTMEVRWPSGLVQSFSNVDPDVFYHLEEGGQLMTSLIEYDHDQRPFTLFPDPVITDLMVRWHDGSSVHHWSIFDEGGRLVLQGTLTGPEGRIPLADMRAGAYRFVCSSAKGRSAAGFIKY